MPLTVSALRQGSGRAFQLLRLVLALTTLVVLAVPMCAEGSSGHEATGMGDPMAVGATAEPGALTSMLGPDHCAWHICAAPIAATGPDTRTGDPKPPHRGVLMSCLLLLVAVLVAALWRSWPPTAGRSDCEARAHVLRLPRFEPRCSRLRLCVFRI